MDGSVYLAYDYPVLGAFWTVMWIFLWVLWLILLFRIIVDVFRDHEMNGWVKAAWLLFLILIPFLGVLVYVIARGKSMGKREVEHAQQQQEAFNAYIRDTAKGGSAGEELTRLSQLKEKGDLSEEEFQKAKEKLLH
ncbi:MULTISPECIES: SHOCT domain-containing protein [unclassified Streptomyces]|uniref:SHOCT domain-containing protein n=1 Tax=unclassified Streptomyces TaxID=2593676 RepID=UPI0021C8CDBC|nr:SHOCT domain-containing protein [Streptomyces sp. FIT100]UUN30657.1 PLDc N-terminal domain-containing protein [Streptomyces sp. FIT100]